MERREPRPFCAVQSTAESAPISSITARRSSMRVSRVGTSRTRSERPVPRLSIIVRRVNDASSSMKRTSSGCSHTESRSPAKPRTKMRSTGPLPTVS
jgi:hypothetical protein